MKFAKNGLSSLGIRETTFNLPFLKFLWLNAVMCYQYCYWRCIKVALYIFLSFEVLSLIFCLCFKVFLVLRRLVFESSINVQIISERESRYWKAEGSIETWRIYCHSYSAINTRANTVPWSVVPRTGGTLQEDDWKNSCCLEEKRSAVKHEKLCKCLNISSLWNTESRQDSRGQAYSTATALKMSLQILPVFYHYSLWLTSTKYSFRGFSLIADGTSVLCVFFCRMCQENALKCMLQIQDY